MQNVFLWRCFLRFECQENWALMARISKVTPENGKPNLIGTMKKKVILQPSTKIPWRNSVPVTKMGWIPVWRDNCLKIFFTIYRWSPTSTVSTSTISTSTNFRAIGIELVLVEFLTDCYVVKLVLVEIGYVVTTSTNFT